MTTHVTIENVEGPDAIQVKAFQGNAFRIITTLQPGEDLGFDLYKGTALQLEECPASIPREISAEEEAANVAAVFVGKDASLDYDEVYEAALAGDDLSRFDTDADLKDGKCIDITESGDGTEPVDPDADVTLPPTRDDFDPDAILADPPDADSK